MKKVTNFARFYACLKTLQTPCKEDLKEQLVSQFTNGRTTSLREMKLDEYNAMCDSIDSTMQEKNLLRKHRSAALHQMQQLGVNTSDWDAVDKFCIQPRIAGKQFYKLTTTELIALKRKLIAIAAKGRRPTNDHSGVKPRYISDQAVDLLLRSTPTAISN